MAVLAPAVSGAVKAAVRVEQTSERAEDLRHISELLDRLAAGCVWPSAQTRKDLLVGGGDQMTFLSRGTADGNPSERDAQDRRCRERPCLRPVESNGPGQEQRDYDAIGSRKHRSQVLRTRNRLTRPLAGATGGDAARPPLLIALRGTLSGSTKEISIEALIGGQAPIGCEYDPISLGCRGEK